MLNFIIILVEPKNDGNIGAVCRVMKNFGLSKLVIVNHPNIGEDAFRRAMHSNDILQHAVHRKTLNEAVKDVDIVVGTSGKTNFNLKNFLRQSFTPHQFAKSIRNRNCSVGLLFGREDFGLVNKELRICDILIKIPNSPDYPSMNISHAVAIILYELFMIDYSEKKARKLSKIEKEKLFEFFDRIVDTTNYTAKKKEKAKILFKRLMARAIPTEHEFSILMGVFNKILRNTRKKG